MSTESGRGATELGQRWRPAAGISRRGRIRRVAGPDGHLPPTPTAWRCAFAHPGSALLFPSWALVAGQTALSQDGLLVACALEQAARLTSSNIPSPHLPHGLFRRGVMQRTMQDGRKMAVSQRLFGSPLSQAPNRSDHHRLRQGPGPLPRRKVVTIRHPSARMRLPLASAISNNAIGGNALTSMPHGCRPPPRPRARRLPLEAARAVPAPPASNDENRIQLLGPESTASQSRRSCTVPSPGLPLSDRATVPLSNSRSCARRRRCAVCLPLTAGTRGDSHSPNTLVVLDFVSSIPLEIVVTATQTRR